MRSPEDLCDWAIRKYRNSHYGWLALPDFGKDLEYSFFLQAPTEAMASKCMDAVAQWISLWRCVDWPEDFQIHVEWKTAKWRSYGTQQLPVRVRVKGSEALAFLAKRATEWKHLVEASRTLEDAWSNQDIRAVLPRIAPALLKLDTGDLTRLVEVVDWLIAHPASGMLVRQLPIKGIDSKWLERHHQLVSQLKAALSDDPDLGLATSPVLFTVRALGSQLEGMHDQEPSTLSAPIPELSKLIWKPAWVLIVENYQTLMALPSFFDMVAVFGKGKDVGALVDVPWIHDAPHLLYWGDLDTHGMHILSLARKAFPQIESLLMDSGTLEDFLDMAVDEPRPFAGAISQLTQAELEVLTQLRTGDIRLEQERIDMAYAHRIIEKRMQG